MSDEHLSKGSELWFCPGPTTPGRNGLFYLGCDQIIKDLGSFDSIGKIILCDFSFPSADAVYNLKTNRVSRQFLREYLSFLEVIVLYEQLLVVNLPYLVTAEDYKNKSSPIYSTFPYFDYAGDANLNEEINKLRSNESWILETVFDFPGMDIQPTNLAAQALALGKPKRRHPLHAVDLYSDVFFSGQPLAAYELAKRLSLPFYGPKVEYHPLVKSQEDSSELLERRVISKLKEQLDSGAKLVLDELSRHGNHIHFNTSPIAALILERASEPKDMMSVALELREKYEPFRATSNSLEKVIYDPKSSVKKKMRAVAEIERVANRLWGPRNGGIDRYIKSSGSLLDYTLNYDDEGLSVKKVTDLILSAPVEYVLEKIRNRRYRLLFDARNSFLKQAAVEAKVARLFAPDSKSAAEVDFDEISCLHWWESHLSGDVQNTEQEVNDDFDDDIPF